MSGERERPSLEVDERAAKDASDAVARFVAELQAAIDHDDADTYDQRLASDVIWGSPYGATVHGYETLHAIHVRMHRQPGASPASHSRFEIDRVRVPAPDVAIAHVRRVALDAAGRPVEPSSDPSVRFSEMALYVLIRRDGTWWLAAGQNTPIRPGPSSGG
jgi:uncharacterized protein (TIGR02246 family)